MIDSALAVMASAGELASKIQEENNTPEMIAAARAQLHAAWMDHIDNCTKILQDPNSTKAQKDEAFRALMKLES